MTIDALVKIHDKTIGMPLQAREEALISFMKAINEYEDKVNFHKLHGKAYTIHKQERDRYALSKVDEVLEKYRDKPNNPSEWS